MLAAADNVAASTHYMLARAPANPFWHPDRVANGAGGFLPSPAGFTDGFPTEQLDSGAHPLASGIVSWVPQEWQDFSLLYGKDEAFVAWYEEQRANQVKYQIPNFGRNLTCPAWTEFQSTSNELYNRYAIEAINASSAEEVEDIWNKYVSEWLASGGEAATAEMSELLKTVYAD